MSASASAVGSGTTAQSAKTNCRSKSGEIIRKKLDTVRIPGLRARICRPAFSTAAVVERLPATPTSTSPRRTIMAAAASGQPMVSRAWASVTDRPASRRSAMNCSALRASRLGLSCGTT